MQFQRWLHGVLQLLRPDHQGSYSCILLHWMWILHSYMLSGDSRKSWSSWTPISQAKFHIDPSIFSLLKYSCINYGFLPSLFCLRSKYTCIFSSDFPSIFINYNFFSLAWSDVKSWRRDSWQHLLHITPLDKGESRDCKACTRSIRGVSLRCSSCHFDLHVSCSKPAQRALKHKAHKHRLFYFSEKWLSSFMKCNFCDENFEGCNFYRCVDCDVNFHVECIPLPRVVKNDKSHQHPVKLLSSLGLVCDREEYCCDVCKEQGNAGHHVYYCDECNFMAHIECVLLQVPTYHQVSLFYFPILHL